MNNFALVREAFCRNLAESLKRLNVAVKATAIKGQWVQVACPLCPDSSGSASISSQSGYLRCHQCGAKADLFTWAGQQMKLSQAPWDVCQQLANVLGVHVEAAKMGANKWKKVPPVTPEVVADLKQRLFRDPDSEGARKFLINRKLWDPAALEALPIGAHGRCIVFFQHDQNGQLLQRAKIYDPTPPAGYSKWTYSQAKTGGGRTVAMWPYLEEPPKEGVIILTEGEWDCLTAMLRLKQPFVQCWTGGGGAPLPPDAIPLYFRHREVQIIYDNDVFQGIGEDIAPDEKKAAEMRTRKRNLIESVGGALLAHKCSVHLRAITIPPLAQWGGDLRDMVDAGLEDINTLPIFPLSACKDAMHQPKAITFEQVHQHLNQYVSFRCQVGGMGEDVVMVPKRHEVVCPRGEKKCCEYCKVPQLAPNGIFDWEGKQEQLAQAITSPNMPRYVMDTIFGKPATCRECTLKPVDVKDGARWHAMAKEDDEKEGARTVEIVSDQNPPLSGELAVRGWLYIGANGLTPVLMCDKLDALDRLEMPIEPHRAEMLGELPTQAETVEEIDEYLERWHRDVSNNTTHVYGRKDIHITLMLTAHSALWFDLNGTRRRGWLDTCIIGATRTGKSAAVRAYMKATFGQLFTPMGNFSRAGLTVGSTSIGGVNKFKPGLFPRNHGKMAGIDEAHLMVQDDRDKTSLFPMLQGARDVGKVEAAKITGSAMLPAAVRLVAIANYLNGGRTSFATPAQHLLALYGTPESLARLDFGVPVDEMTDQVGPESVPQFWTSERQKILVIRAWNMPPEKIFIDDDAKQLAFSLCEEKWRGQYTEDVPLFTVKEKVYSVLRIAIAIANATLSYRELDVDTCRVRKVHVEWAAKWLEHTWSLLEYDSLSRNMMSRTCEAHSWQIEGHLTIGLDLRDPTSVTFVLGRLYGVLSKEEMRSVVGKNGPDFEMWVMRMIRSGGLDVVRNSTFGTSVGMRLTKAAIDIMARLIALAENDHRAWGYRYDQLTQWYSSNGPVRRSFPSTISPIDAPTSVHIDDFRRTGLGH